ncbi:MAG TPA: hypothetical protein V6C97_01135, partial [Oculatellaceae cyanobacterium]
SEPECVVCVAGEGEQTEISVPNTHTGIIIKSINYINSWSNAPTPAIRRPIAGDLELQIINLNLLLPNL